MGHINDFVALNGGSPTRISSRGIPSAPDIFLAQASWSDRFAWSVEAHINSDHLPIVLDHRGASSTIRP